MYTSGSSKLNYELLQEYLLNQQTIEDTIVYCLLVAAASPGVRVLPSCKSAGFVMFDNMFVPTRTLLSAGPISMSQRMLYK